MTIIFCLFKYFPYGGLQRDFLRIALECQRRGAKIIVYTLAWDGPVPDGFDIHIVPVRAFSNHRRVKKFAEWVLRSEFRVQDLGFKSSRSSIFNLQTPNPKPQTPNPNLQTPTSNLQSPILTVGFNKMPGLDVYYAADACFKEKAVTQRGMFYRLGARYRLYTKFEEAVFGENAKTEILMISKLQEPLFRKHYGTQKERMHFLPPNVARDRIAPANANEIRTAFRRKNELNDDEKLIVQIGSGFKTKGVDRSIRAVASLPSEIRQKTILWIIGKDRAARFKKLAKELCISDRIVFTGGRDDVPQILLGADLMIHPAYNENTGTTLLEAMASGLPVLCTEICGYSTYICDADSGIAVPEPFDQHELNRRLLDLLTAGNLPALHHNALAYAKTHDLFSMHEEAADAICKEANKAILNR